MVKIRLCMQGVVGQSLVGELGPHMTRGQRTKTKQKQYCNESNTDF